MSEERTAIEAVSESFLGRGVASTWERLAPLSAGAVATSVVIVGARAVLRRAVGRGGARALGLLAAASLVPLGLWWLSEPVDSEGPEQGSAESDTLLPDETRTSDKSGGM
jgi:uncharacterized membrane protein